MQPQARAGNKKAKQEKAEAESNSSTPPDEDVKLTDGLATAQAAPETHSPTAPPRTHAEASDVARHAEAPVPPSVKLGATPCHCRLSATAARVSSQLTKVSYSAISRS